MSAVAGERRARGRPPGIAGRLGGRAHVVRTTALSIALAVVVAVACGLLAPGSREVVTGIGDLPARPQDEVRVAAEVWFTLAVASLAVLTTILWWRPWRPRGGSGGEPDPVEDARGPVGLGIATAAALVQTAVAIVAWRVTVSLRGFAEPGEIGEDRIAAPILSGTVSVWVAAAAAVLTYLVLVIVAPTSALTSRPPAGSETGDDPSAGGIAQGGVRPGGEPSRAVSPGSRRVRDGGQVSSS